MKRNNLMTVIKNWLAFGITILLLVVLFGIIFISLDLVTPGPSFFLELGVVVCLSFIMRVFWYEYAEEKRLSEQDILEEKSKHFDRVDEVVTDSNDLDKYLIILNQENRDHYIKNKIGSRTAINMSKKTFWLCFFHPSYRKLSADEIGSLRYNKLYFKVQLKADKLKPLKSEDILALSDSDMLYDTKNYAKTQKRKYQIASTILSTVFTILIASIAFKEILLNWTNVFRYITYLFSMVATIAITIIKAYKTTGEETLDWFSRLKFILYKYADYKNKNSTEEVVNNDVVHGHEDGLYTTTERAQ